MVPKQKQKLTAASFALHEHLDCTKRNSVVLLMNEPVSCCRTGVGDQMEQPVSAVLSSGQRESGLDQIEKVREISDL